MPRFGLVFLAFIVGAVALEGKGETEEQPAGGSEVTKITDGLHKAGATASAVGSALSNLTDIKVNGTNVSSVASVIVNIMRHELESSGNQWFDGLVSLVLGAWMLYDGLHVFEIFILVICWCSTYILMMGNYQTGDYVEVFGPGGQAWQKIVSLQVAFFVMNAFKSSIDLVKKLLGLMLGIWAFSHLQSYTVHLAEEHQLEWLVLVGTSGPFFVILGTICFCYGVWLFSEGPSYVFAIVAPLFGAIMLTSSIFFFMTYFQTPSLAVWVDYVDCMLGGQCKGPGMKGASMGMRGLAFFIFLVAASLQYSVAHEEKKHLGESVCDKVIGCLGLQTCVSKNVDMVEPLLREKDQKIRELEEQVRRLEAAKGS